jgi:DNA invertase Pin-like site-specific DNA recombinase
MTMKEMRAALYVRVSTSEQDTALQETELRQYVESRGWECVVYQDKAQSGAKNDRPALNQMLSDMRRRRFDVVVVWKLDRLARSLKQLLTIWRRMSVSGRGLGFAETKHRYHTACRKIDLSNLGSGGRI